MTWDERLQKLAERRALAQTRVLLSKADAAYAAHSCPASAECCQLAKRNREPWLWPTEWALILEELARQKRALPPERADGACPFLSGDGLRCTVYSARPFGCRTYFCERRLGPAREPLEEVNGLLTRLELASQTAFPEIRGPRTLTEWHGKQSDP